MTKIDLVNATLQILCEPPKWLSAITVLHVENWYYQVICSRFRIVENCSDLFYRYSYDQWSPAITFIIRKAAPLLLLLLLLYECRFMWTTILTWFNKVWAIRLIIQRPYIFLYFCCWAVQPNGRTRKVYSATLVDCFHGIRIKILL